MALEHRLLEELASRADWFSFQGWTSVDDGDAAALIRLDVPGKPFEGLLVYPRYFPDVPAFIRPQDRKDIRSGHQYLGSGVLCLDRGPDNWHSSFTGTNLVESAYTLLLTEVARTVIPEVPAVPSRHRGTRGQEVRSEEFRFVITPGFHATASAKSKAQRAALKASWSSLNDKYVWNVISVGDARVPDVADAAASDGRDQDGWLLQVESCSAIGAVADAASIKAALGAAWPWPDDLPDAHQVLVLRDASAAVRAFIMGVGSKRLFVECTVIDYGAEQPARQPEAYTRLRTMGVGIVGLGSVGSKIAVSLARAGFGRFVLVDDDVLAPHNVVRNGLDWQGVGFQKVQGVAQAIRRVASGVAITALERGVATQENPRLSAQVVDELGSCDLVIDATANANAFLTLAAVCKRAGVPLVWGELFAGGTGALMARSRPGKDADALSVRAHIHGVLKSFPASPDQKATDYSIEAGDAVLVAGDAEVSALAASITQFAIDAVSASEASEYPVAAYLIGYKKYWVFRQPFDVIPIDCASALRNDATRATPTAEDQAVVASIVAAMSGGHDAADNRAT